MSKAEFDRLCQQAAQRVSANSIKEEDLYNQIFQKVFQA